eukprot:11173084-Lingulodinium_polyedra.AAC.1
MLVCAPKERTVVLVPQKFLCDFEELQFEAYITAVRASFANGYAQRLFARRPQRLGRLWIGECATAGFY